MIIIIIIKILQNKERIKIVECTASNSKGRNKDGSL